jgi:hypothetical protein
MQYLTGLCFPPERKQVGMETYRYFNQDRSKAGQSKVFCSRKRGSVSVIKQFPIHLIIILYQGGIGE